MSSSWTFFLTLRYSQIYGRLAQYQKKLLKQTLPVPCYTFLCVTEVINFKEGFPLPLSFSEQKVWEEPLIKASNRTHLEGRQGDAIAV